MKHQILLACFILLICSCGGGSGSTSSSGKSSTTKWIKAMEVVADNGVIKGTVSGNVTQIGDSITYSMAFLAGMKYGNPSGSEWQTLRDHVDGDLINSRKGTAHANFSGWESADALAVISGILATHDSEMAVLMLGTNDVKNDVSIVTYESNMRAIVNACLDAGCIPIISTIPPMNAKPLSTVQAFNDVVKDIARDNNLPLIDYYDEILTRQPGTDWDGTLISGDGIHPSNPGGSDLWDFSESNLDINGYALRNYLACEKMQEVIEKVLAPVGSG